MKLEAFRKKYLAEAARTRARRMKWWHDARFGMFIHWGLYSQVGRNEWVLNLERIPPAEYERLADSWHPKPGAAREWAALAKAAGMKYMVLTTKHHEGFCLWDTKHTAYNAVKRGPGRDLVAEYVRAARAEGLRVGFYYSLMDWHHPDAIRCLWDEAARRRFAEYTRNLVRELMTCYGRIDLLWYDVSWPLPTAELWESWELNSMVRRLQPGIIINDRAKIPEDYGTPEEHITPERAGRAWEACMTFNGSWGWQKTPPEDWHSVRKVIEMLRQCAAGEGNLLLNIGPLPDGSVPREAVERLTAVGRWLKTYGGVVYGKVERCPNFTSALGNWSRKGNTQYFWCSRWPGRQMSLAAVGGKLKRARLYPDGKELPFVQTHDRIVISGLPERCPDRIAGVGMVELQFASPPTQYFDMGPVMPKVIPTQLKGKWVAPPIRSMQLSRLLETAGPASEAPPAKLSDDLGWRKVDADASTGMIHVQDWVPGKRGVTYLGTTLKVKRAGAWRLHLGHSGACRVFVDGEPVLSEFSYGNFFAPRFTQADLALKAGRHELVVAFDPSHSRWGFYACFEIPPSARVDGKAVFPSAQRGERSKAQSRENRA